MAQIVKNYTFSLPIDLLDKLKKFSIDGYIPSVNGAVKEALESYVKQIEKQNLYNQMKIASEDPMFLQDVKEAMNDFSYADFEATREKEE